MIKNIVIIGAGDFGKEVAWLIDDINKVSPAYKILGYLDDDVNKQGQIFNGHSVLGTTDILYEFQKSNNICAVIAMQNGDVRKRIVDKFSNFDNWETLVHNSVNISDTSSMGKGCILCAGTNVSVNTVIGSHCLFNISATVGHDCIIGDYVSTMSGSCICGNVTVQDLAYLSTNCTVIPGKTVGIHSVVGAGSVVIRNVKDNTTVMGVPAKKVEF